MTDISYIESSNHLAAKEGEWRVAVGRFILGFGSIEWFTYHMLAELPTERIFESTMSLGFRQRMDIVIQLLREKNLDAKLTERAVAILQQAKELAETRNLIAHNPLFLNLFDDRVGVDLQYQISKYGEIKARLTIDELQNRCRDIEKLVEELYKLREQIEGAISRK